LYRLPVVSKPFTLDEVASLLDAVTTEGPREVTGEF